MSDKLLHIYYLYLMRLISFIHLICFSCSPTALTEYHQGIQQHPLQNLLEKLPPHWSSLSDPNLASLPVLEVYTIPDPSRTQSRILTHLCPCIFLHLHCDLLARHFFVTLLTISSVSRLNEPCHVLLFQELALSVIFHSPPSVSPFTRALSLLLTYIYVWISPVIKISHNHKLSNSITHSGYLPNALIHPHPSLQTALYLVPQLFTTYNMASTPNTLLLKLFF